jgi:hypothetical protein
MRDSHLKTPVAFFIFNRPDKAARVFAAIRQAAPSTLMVVADGPRQNIAEDAAQCQACRALIQQVDWQCEVLTNFSDENIGLRNRVSSGLDWIFQKAEVAIILEDDCLPDITFFRYCEDLLAKYHDDERVMNIGGTDFNFRRAIRDYSYYFTRYPQIWGWATWRRAWQHYDVHMKRWNEADDRRILLGQFERQAERQFWADRWNKASSGQVNSWAYQWSFACLSRQALCINPAVNLVTNIGFGDAATNTVRKLNPMINAPRMQMGFPLKHPPHMERNQRADRDISKMIYSTSPVEKAITRLKYFAKKARGG